MSLETYPHHEVTPDNDRVVSDYGLDKDRWAALSAEARVAFGIAWLEANEEVFENSREITAALVEATNLEDGIVRKANRALLQRGYLDRSGFMTGNALKLSLSDEGYDFLEREVAAVQ